MRVPQAVLLGAVTATFLSGCQSDSGSGSGPDAAADGSARPSATATGTDPNEPVPDEEPASTEVPGEDERGPEPPDAGGVGGVTVSLPGLPIGGAESVSSGAGDACVTASYLGDSEEQSIPVGARIRVTTVHFSPDLLAVAGDGCSPSGRLCMGGDAFTDEDRNCLLPVRVIREPRPPAGDEPDSEGLQETVSVRMDGVVSCAPALQDECSAFARSLDGIPTQMSVTVSRSSAPDWQESSTETTAPGSAPATSGVPEPSAEPSEEPTADPSTGASPPSG